MGSRLGAVVTLSVVRKNVRRKQSREHTNHALVKRKELDWESLVFSSEEL